jgi:hypothetical protein
MITTQQLAITYAQADKIKSGLIWISQTIQISEAMPPAEKKGAETVLQNILHMVGDEVHMIARIGNGQLWQEAAADVDKALVMMRSGVPGEAVHHLTRALSAVTSIAGRAMTLLQPEKENQAGSLA